MRMKCKCCGEKMVPIVYGLPGSDLFRKAERGEVVLGGCIIEPGQPKWVCIECEEKEESV